MTTTNRLAAIIAATALAIASFISAAQSPCHQCSSSTATDSTSGPWVAMIVVPDIAKATKAVGGEWIDLEQLPFTDKPDSHFSGLILRHINGAYIFSKATLERFVDGTETYFLNNLEPITHDQFKALPISDIVCMMVCGGQVRVYTRAAIGSGNPVSPLATCLEVIGNYNSMQAQSALEPVKADVK